MSKRSFELSADNGLQKIDPETGLLHNTSALPLVCERIRYFREKCGMDQKEMAKRLGITANAISNWENGRSRPDINLLPAICNILNITFYDIFDIPTPVLKTTDKQQELISKYESLNKGHRFIVQNLINDLLTIEEAESCPDLKVLLYFSRSLAAGIGDPTEFEEDAEAVYVYSTPEVACADSIFKINGDSMEPAFSDGQDVLVQKINSKSGIDFGEIGAFIIGSETYIKKYEKDGLHSLNPAYPVMHFDDTEAVYLIGRVIGVFDPTGYARKEDIERYKILHQ